MELRSRRRLSQNAVSDDIGRIERNSFNVFVDNLPLSMSKGWLFQLFGWAGKVTDIYMSRKQRKSSQNPFAFVRYASRFAAEKAICDLDGMVIRKCKMRVSKAKYGRQGKETGSGKVMQNQPVQLWRPIEKNHSIRKEGRSYRDALKEGVQKTHTNKDQKTHTVSGKQQWNREGEPKMKIVYGTSCQSQLQTLEKSLIGETLRPVDFKMLSEEVIKNVEGVSEVCELGAYKALIVFESKQSMEEQLSKCNQELSKFFEDVRIWCEEEWCQTRRVWIECFGIPIHAWSNENIKKIGEEWGAVVCLDELTEAGKSFSTARMLIDTCLWQNIQGWVYFSIDGKGYDVYVKEVGLECYSQWWSESKRPVWKNHEKNQMPNPSVPANEAGSCTPATMVSIGPVKTKETEGARDKNVFVKKMRTKVALEGVERGDGGDVPHKGTVESKVGESKQSQTQTACLHDIQNSEEIIQKLLSNKKKKGKGLIYVISESGSVLVKGAKRLQAEGINLTNPSPSDLSSPKSPSSAPPGFEKGITRMLVYDKDNADPCEVVAETDYSGEIADGNEGNEVSNPHEEAVIAWEIGKEVGLFAEEEEDIMIRLEAKNKEKAEKKRAKKKGKKGAKQSAAMTKTGALQNLK